MTAVSGLSYNDHYDHRDINLWRFLCGSKLHVLLSTETPIACGNTFLGALLERAQFLNN